MIKQIEFRLPAMKRGCHLITSEIVRRLPQPLPECALVNIFVKHTSCALSVNENADPDVRVDLNAVLDRLPPENAPFYPHPFGGPDDMPAHAKSSLLGVSLTVPVSGGRLNLGTWQGIYLCEFRDYGGPRFIVITVYY